MPQELHVLRCFSCKTFQVQIVKKVPKWQCKMCNEKQSVLKVYAKGSGKDCRQFVQDLNMQQGVLASENSSESNHLMHQEDALCPGPEYEEYTRNSVQTSKWSDFMEPKINNESPMHKVEDKNFSGQYEMPHNSKASKWKNYLVEEKEDSNFIDAKQYNYEQYSVQAQSKKRKFSQWDTGSRDNTEFNEDFQENCKPFKSNTFDSAYKKSALTSQFVAEKKVVQVTATEPLDKGASKWLHFVSDNLPPNCTSAKKDVSKSLEQSSKLIHNPNKMFDVTSKTKMPSEQTCSATKTPFCTLSDGESLDDILDF